MSKINGLNSDVFSFTNEFQRNIIVMMIQNPEIFERVGVLVEPNCFEIKEYRDIFRSIKEYFNEYRNLPSKEILYNEVRKVNDTENLYKDIDNIYNNILLNSGSVEYIENQIKEFVSYQAIKKAVIESIEDLNDTDKHSMIKDRIEKAVNVKALMEDNGVDVYSTDAIVKRWESRINDNDVVTIPTNWRGLDEVLGGGLKGGTLTTFMGVANTGKSFWLQNICVNLIQNKYNVVYISLELSEQLVMERFDCRLLGITSQELKKSSNDSIKKLKEVIDKHIGNLYIKTFPANTVTCVDIEAFINKIETIHKVKIDAIVIDYCDILKPSQRYKERRHELNDVYLEARNIALKRNIPVITATQLSRSGLKAMKEGQILDSEYISECYAINQTVDNSLTINSTPSDIINHTQILYIAKNRTGPVGQQIRFYVDFAKALIKEWDADNVIADTIEEKNKETNNNIEQKNILYKTVRTS